MTILITGATGNIAGNIAGEVFNHLTKKGELSNTFQKWHRQIEEHLESSGMQGLICLISLSNLQSVGLITDTSTFNKALSEKQ